MENNIQQPDNNGQQATPSPVPQSPAPAQQDPGLSERTTEQFDKLTDSNRRLKEANDALLRKVDELAQIQQQQLAPKEVPKADPEEFIVTDPQTGESYVDQQKLKKVIEDTRQQAMSEVKKEVDALRQQQEQREAQRQTEEAYRAYPQLDNKSKDFDKDLTQKTRAFLLDSMMHPADYNGRPLTFKEAADLATKGQPKVAEPTEDKLEKKQQATQQVQGTPSTAVAPQQSADEELMRLRMVSRKGGQDGLWAIAQRLQNVPHSGTPTNSDE